MKRGKLPLYFVIAYAANELITSAIESYCLVSPNERAFELLTYNSSLLKQETNSTEISAIQIPL